MQKDLKNPKKYFIFQMCYNKIMMKNSSTKKIKFQYYFHDKQINSI